METYERRKLIQQTLLDSHSSCHRHLAPKKDYSREEDIFRLAFWQAYKLKPVPELSCLHIPGMALKSERARLSDDYVDTIWSMSEWF